MINYSDIKDFCYYCLFEQAKDLVEAPCLPSTTLANSCYRKMFNNSGIKHTPELPATELANYCYNNMFWNCLSLTTPSLLPAKTLAAGCYQYMFLNSNLINIVEDSGQESNLFLDLTNVDVSR